MALAYIEKVPAEIRDNFAAKVEKISARLSINPNWLMQVMYSESRLNPRAQNPSGATGLIQFMPATARGLGTTTAQLLSMSAVQQLDYVYSYFKPYAGKMKSYADVYFVTFFPAAIGRPDDWILKTSGLSAATIAKQNPAVNIVKDNQITVSEFKQYLFKTVPASLRSVMFGGGFPVILFIALIVAVILLTNQNIKL